MFRQYVNFVVKNSTGKMAIVLLIVYLIFNLVVMGWGAKHINSLSGKEVQVLDLCLTGYSPTEANAYLSDYSPEARKFAATFNATADTVYPLLYTAMLTVLLAWVYKNRIGSGRRLGHILLLPLLLMLVDFLENYHIISMLKLKTDLPVGMVMAGSFFTKLKWSMLAIIILLIPAGLLFKKKH